MCEIQFAHYPPGDGDTSKKRGARGKSPKKDKDYKKGPGVSFSTKLGKDTPTATIRMKPGKAKRHMLVNFGGLYATPLPKPLPHKCHRDGGQGGPGGSGGSGGKGLLGGLMGGRGGGGRGGGGGGGSSQQHECHHGHTHGPLGAVFGVASGLMRSFMHHEHHSELFNKHRHGFRNGMGTHKHHNFRWSKT